jgi:hypothetical protein
VPEVEACFLQYSQENNPIFSLHLRNFPGLLQELVRPELELQSNPKGTTTMPWNEILDSSLQDP